jgi:subtilisin family serine protease
MTATRALRETVLQDALSLVGLPPLMALGTGSARVPIGLVDGPVALDHPDLAGGNIREVRPGAGSACARRESVACRHGTFVAGILVAMRRSRAPAICPDCPLLVRPICSAGATAKALIPSATPEALAAAIIDCVDAGARIVNASAALEQLPTARGERELEWALDHAAARGVIVVAASGNQGQVGSTTITRHPAVIAASACDLFGRPIAASNHGRSIGLRGLRAPGEAVTSLGTAGDVVTSGGTSVAAPFVTGALALAWSRFPDATADQVRLAVMVAHSPRPAAVVPPLLDAWAIHAALTQMMQSRRPGPQMTRMTQALD